MKTMRTVTLSLLVFLCPVLGFARGRVPVPNLPPRLTENVKNFEFQPFEDDQGGFYLVWIHAAASDTTPSLLAQHLDAQGNSLWTSPLVVGRRVDAVDGWQAFADGHGGGVVTWVRHGALFARRLSAAGTLSGSDELAISLSTGAARTPTGVADAAGGAFIVWAQELYPQRTVLLMQHVDASGRTLWKEADMRVSLRSSDQRRPNIVTDGQGGSFVAWNDDRSQSSQIQLQHMDFIGDRLLGPEGLLVTAPASTAQDSPILEPLFDQGQVVLTWLASQDAVDRIFLERFDGKGRPLWPPPGIAPTVGASNQWNPVISAANDGTLWLAWGDYRDQMHWRAFLAHLDAQGHPLGGLRERPITDVSADQGDLAITDDGQGGVFAAWFDDRTGDSGLYYQDVDAAGNNHFPPDGKNLMRGLNDPQTPELVPLGAGRTAVLWANHPRKGLWGLYWTVVDGHSL